MNAIDTHFHIFRDKYPSATGRKRAEATVGQYNDFRHAIGISRSVIIAPSTYGRDNACLLEALGELGREDTRAVIIPDGDMSATRLDELHQLGVRGLRLYAGHGDLDDEAALRQFAAIAADRGWHLQLVGEQHAEPFAALETRLASLPCNLVFDHFGFASQPDAMNSATAQALRRLLENGRTYVKLSGMYIQSKVGPPTYDDFDALASDLVRRAPDRMLWGSDWRHTLATVRPSGADLLRKVGVWAPDPAGQLLILSSNAKRLYWAS